MAMAYLFSRLKRMLPNFTVADNPVQAAHGVVVDHGLRHESDKEALRVARELKRLGLEAHLRSVNWRAEKELGIDPSTLPNLEGVARTKRYRLLGRTCLHLHSHSLFLAHHRDDQYETVLMRLLTGHTYRGLQGIRRANDIPECYDMYGVHKSGLLEDQKLKHPYLRFNPPASQLRRLRRALRHERVPDSWDQWKHFLGADSTSAPFPGRAHGPANRNVPYLTPLASEDGGVMVYRPLLDFDKSRLIATCEANGVQWFEDRTNLDPTLTTRNAVRHLTREPHALPQALRKPAILAMAQRSARRVELEEAEAQRLLIHRAVIQDLDPNTGTLLARLPVLGRRGVAVRSRYARAREQQRQPRRRIIAAVSVRKLIEFVTPDTQAPLLSNLEKTVQRLFPELAGTRGEGSRKAFSIAGVLFEPVGSGGGRGWLLSRAPKPSQQATPLLRLSSPRDLPLSSTEAREDAPRHRRLRWHGWTLFKLWDGRFWIRLRRNISARFHIEPLLRESLKPFKRALPPQQRAKLERTLKHYAPGKVRYTLPALYSAEEDGRPRQGQGQARDGESTRLTLLALPSLGFHVPGLERWVKYEVRYQRIDSTLLGSGGKARSVRMLGYLSSCSASRRRRLEAWVARKGFQRRSRRQRHREVRHA